jgi:hypothetical protein
VIETPVVDQWSIHYALAARIFLYKQLRPGAFVSINPNLPESIGNQE